MRNEKRWSGETHRNKEERGEGSSRERKVHNLGPKPILGQDQYYAHIYLW